MSITQDGSFKAERHEARRGTGSKSNSDCRMDPSLSDSTYYIASQRPRARHSKRCIDNKHIIADFAISSFSQASLNPPTPIHLSIVIPTKLSPLPTHSPLHPFPSFIPFKKITNPPNHPSPTNTALKLSSLTFSTFAALSCTVLYKVGGICNKERGAEKQRLYSAGFHGFS